MIMMIFQRCESKFFFSCPKIGSAFVTFHGYFQYHPCVILCCYACFPAP